MSDSVTHSRSEKITRFRRRSIIALGVALAVAMTPLVLANPRTSPAAVAAPAVAAVDDSQLNAGPPSRGGNYMHDADAPWVRPVPGKVTSVFGPRPVICTPAGCSNTTHDGIDLGSPCGTDIKAISPGRVTSASNAGSFGERVIIDHGSGLESIYGHMQTGSYRVSVGQLVKAGTIIGKVGMTGVATGCHLDLKIRTGAYIDPKPFLAFRGVTL
ncbi:murein DD-endopeptidase MepM/ murein hydrolase activator NlpD [Okibacterium sp. HSC-33S16]|uniref:M23 family metallopeptidase n=1 Tax=Okibacterium sp. HSC-33S16 TaxID=2910965 RepID=UPI0020A1DE6B|nr:M23 family metallopeptidase [Okibacterium sp. HSC-33S16]MCP2032673.1 murein DD-endopeptidase MepM/ murein hydrolase activator NlpD [Okibacterium sp. HSC-33S16]